MSSRWAQKFDDLPIASMKIYTKTGDKGETSLFGGKRVSKDSVRIDAYGNVDELNSQLGVVRGLKPQEDLDRALTGIQNDLFVLGADLATPRGDDGERIPRMTLRHAEALEELIDTFEERLPPLKSFVLPAGSSVAAVLHVARTVCRRAERIVVHLSRFEEIGAEPVTYLNRLSDLLFVMARYANLTASAEETKWIPPAA